MNELIINTEQTDSSAAILPKGYKQTELGVIPEDWEVKQIGEISPLQRGFDLPARDRKDGKYPVVYSNGTVNTHNEFQVKGPGVVTGRSGTLGKVHYIESDHWPHNTSLWVTKFNNSTPKFIYFLFKYIGFERFASGSGVPTLNRNDAHSFKVVVPSSKQEQTAIANALSDVDALLNEIEKLISKKQFIKTATMQQLLTGQTRLPEFSVNVDGNKKGYQVSELGNIPEDWEVVELGECTSFIGSGKTNTKAFGNYPLYGSTGVIGSCINPEYRGKAILVARVGANAGKLSFVDGEYGVSDNTIIVKLENEVDIQFIKFLLTRQNLNKLVFGSGQPLITGTQLKNLQILLPLKQEQTAIATILSDMDAEIQALEQQLEKTKQIKQGMMQQLLTGKIRLLPVETQA